MLLEKNQIGKREFLANYITRADAKSTPLLAQIPKGGPIRNMLVEYQVDNFEDPADIAVEDGTDADTFDNASPNRERLGVYATKFRTTAMVSDLAEEVSDVAGLPKGELAESIMKKLEFMGRSIESAMCGEQEQQAGGAGKPYKVRGLGMWIGGSQTVLPVSSTYATSGDALNSTAIAALTQTLVNGVLQSSYEKTGKDQSFSLFCGPTLKKRFSTFTQLEASTVGVKVARYYGTNFTGKIDDVVDLFRGDFGTISLHTSLFIDLVAFGGTSGYNLLRGYMCPMNMLEMNYKRMPRVKQLEDRGGGPRFLIDAIWSFKVKNPLPFGRFWATSAT